MGTPLRFPRGFLWGAATSSHQVEGGQRNDWTQWEERGKIAGGQRSGRACDHWNRFKEDFDLAQKLGHTAHRFSVEWSRIEPREGIWDDAALTHYREVVRALRERGIEPFVTLWHFTNPEWFAARGGWATPEAPRTFARYATRVVEALPEVKFWLTVNEPNVYALLSYLVGSWPPGAKNWRIAYGVLKNLAEAHDAAYASMKRVHGTIQVGPAYNFVFFEPVRQHSLPDRASVSLADHWYNHRWLQWVRRSIDFIGVNHYIHQLIRFGSLKKPISLEPQGDPKTDSGWQIYPEAMYRVLGSASRYGKPLYVTENGLADAHDQWREKYIHDYLVQVHRAIQRGIDVRGYFHWSLLDNFEWAEGFSKRFGLVEVDFVTQQRIIRESARWYADVCRRNAVEVREESTTG